MKEKLLEIGLSNKETDIYLVLLKRGYLKAAEISKQTNILRSSIYDYLESLIEKGFVAYNYKSNIKYFQAVNPDKILENFYEKKELQEKNLKKTINELKTIKPESIKSNIEIYEGKEGIKTIMFNILKTKTPILSYGSSGTLRSLLPIAIEKFQKQREKKKILMYMIYQDVLSKKEIKKRIAYKYLKIKFAPIKELSYTNTIIYDNKVVFIIIDINFSFAILVENKNMYENYKNNFNILWKAAKTKEIK